MHRLRRHLTYANVTATLALLVAVAGGTTAIARSGKAPKNSVVSKSIKAGNVTAKDLTTTFNVTATNTVTDPTPMDNQFATGTAEAHCPAGARALSGGGGAEGLRRVLQFSGRAGEGWRVSIGTDDPVPVQFSATVTCLLPKTGNPKTLP
jgi:hypothetical protein